MLLLRLWLRLLRMSLRLLRRCCSPVYYFQVLLPRERAWAAANAPKPVPPLPPLVPVTEVRFLDPAAFNVFNGTSMQHISVGPVCLAHVRGLAFRGRVSLHAVC
jgi:hypothetical protein